MERKVLTIWLSAIAMVLTCTAATHAEPLLSPWQPQSDMPVADHGFGDAVVGGLIYAIGGAGPDPGWGTNRVQRYNPATDTWVQVASMPTARHSLSCAVVDGYIYAIGGHVTNSRSENERYDPSTDTWQSMARKPTAVSSPGIAAFDGKIFTFGGNRYGSMQSVIEVYDPQTNAWQSVGNMPAAGQPSRAATLGDKIYLAGGYFLSEGGTTDHLWAYDPVSRTWDTSLPRLNIKRGTHELVVVGDYLFVIGGGNATGPLTSVEWWTPGAPGWTLDESLNIARCYLGAEAVGNTIYAFGGWGSPGNLSSTESAVVVLELMVVAPNGGEQLVGGSIYTITWDTPVDSNIQWVKIEYSTDNGQDWNDVDISANTGSYDWDVPAVDSNRCLVRVSDLFDANITDTSDYMFTIFQCRGPIAGDLNGDCYVDWKDFASFAATWLDCGNPFDPDCGVE